MWTQPDSASLVVLDTPAGGAGAPRFSLGYDHVSFSLLSPDLVVASPCARLLPFLAGPPCGSLPSAGCNLQGQWQVHQERGLLRLAVQSVQKKSESALAHQS